ncbi:unnamed protein product [Parajaminaea phylloscopi]
MAALTGLTEAELPPRGSGHSLDNLGHVERDFLHFFQSSGGTVSPSISLFTLPQQGRCYIANDDIEEDSDLFEIPRTALLNTRNSVLPTLLRAHETDHGISPTNPQPEAREEHDMSLDDPVPQNEAGQSRPETYDELSGWTPLILCMMWESWRATEAGAEGAQTLVNSLTARLSAGEMLQGAGSQDLAPSGLQQKWGPYLQIMPRDFSSMPMFWSKQDLQELKGTSVVERVGREEADAEYRDNVKPFILAHGAVFFGPAEQPDNFAELLDKHYSLEDFHIHGSRILSRSFHVERHSASSADTAHGEQSDGVTTGHDGDDSDSEDGQDEHEDTQDISMVPLADLLNASFGSENARLFYSPTSLIMRATRKVSRGEQILNTYADPPNADLLRRYGYVDEWNGADEVELDATLLVNAALEGCDSGVDIEKERMKLLERVSYLVSLGLEESFVLTYAFPPSEQPPHRPEPADPSDRDIQQAIANFDEELLSASRALLLSDDEFEKHQTKEKVPKPRLDEPICSLLLRSLHMRLSMYAGGHSSSHDEELLYGSSSTSLAKGTNTRNAVVVRLGEKRVLENNIMVLTRLLEMKRAEAAESQKRKKGRNEDRNDSQAKKKSRK